MEALFEPVTEHVADVSFDAVSHFLVLSCRRLEHVGARLGNRVAMQGHHADLVGIEAFILFLMLLLDAGF